MITLLFVIALVGAILVLALIVAGLALTVTVEPYQIQLTRPDGIREIVVYYASGSTHAHYVAAELNPGCQVNVIGLLPEWTGDDV